MAEIPAPQYPWYSVVVGSDLEQGDLIFGCPRFVVAPKTQNGVAEHRVAVETVDAVILTQSCDLAPRANGASEVREVILARVVTKEQLVEHPTFKNDAEWENARKGRLAYFHVLNRGEAARLDYSLVDFHEVFTLNIDLVRGLAGAKPERPRLLPPYREHLSQAFARVFMRIGLPADIPPSVQRRQDVISVDANRVVA